MLENLFFFFWARVNGHSTKLPQQWNFFNWADEKKKIYFKSSKTNEVQVRNTIDGLLVSIGRKSVNNNNNNRWNTFVSLNGAIINEKRRYRLHGTFNISWTSAFRCSVPFQMCIYIFRSLPTIQRIHIHIKLFILINFQCSTAPSVWCYVRCTAQCKRSYRKQTCRTLNK